MSIFKELKIWNRQRKAWMQVCHHAMTLFPNAFKFAKPTAKVSARTICGMLDELAARRRRDSVGTVSVRIERYRAPEPDILDLD